MTYENKFKEITRDCGMGVYGLSELMGREVDKRIKELEIALKPFAQFACSDKGECDCHNCHARDLLKQKKPFDV